MASQLFTLSVLAVAVQSALSFCGPEKWEGLEGVSSGNMINGTGGAGQVCVLILDLIKQLIFSISLERD